MKDLHDFLQETEGENRGCFWNNYGFATYKITLNECYIDKIYIKPEYRNQRKAAELADQIVEFAKENGCEYITGTVYTDKGHDLHSVEKYDISVKVLLGYGFKPLKFEEGRAVFIKEI